LIRKRADGFFQNGMSMSELGHSPLEIEVTRGSFIESRHRVDFVLSNSRGRILESSLNSNAVVCPRSGIKPLQALAYVLSGAWKAQGHRSERLALACASHHAEPVHMAVAQSWLDDLKLDESILVCGPQWPYREIETHEMIRQGLSPRRLQNNCSGKHLGFLSTALQLKTDPRDYAALRGPVQSYVRDLLSEMSGTDLHVAAHGTDGCSVPTYSLSASALATAMARLAAAPTPVLQRGAEAVSDAMARHPDLIEGDGSLTTEIIRKTQGRVIVKIGAEGVYCGYSRVQELGFVLKVCDGHSRALPVSLVHLLSRWKMISETELSALQPHVNSVIRNRAQLEVGEIRIAT